MGFRLSEHEDIKSGMRGAKTPKATFIRLGIIGFVLAVGIAYMIYAAFPGNTLYFLTVSEFMEKEEYQDGRVLRVSGKLLDGSFNRPKGSTSANFALIDSLNNSNPGLEARYVGVMPDLFFNPHSEIILQGSYSMDEVFEAETVLVKCPSKYQSMEEEYGEDYMYDEDKSTRS